MGLNYVEQKFIPDNFLKDIREFLSLYEDRLDIFRKVWLRVYSLGDIKGFMGLADKCIIDYPVFINMPIFSIPYKGINFDNSEIMFIADNIPNLLKVKFIIVNNTLFIRSYDSLGDLNELDADYLINGLIDGVEEMRDSFISAIENQYPELKEKGNV